MEEVSGTRNGMNIIIRLLGHFFSTCSFVDEFATEYIR